jgi:small acid-soluble spore protein H (minor)
MELKRAKEIVASPIMLNVTHNGIPIYIESIAADNTTHMFTL